MTRYRNTSQEYAMYPFSIMFFCNDARGLEHAKEIASRSPKVQLFGHRKPSERVSLTVDPCCSILRDVRCRRDSTEPSPSSDIRSA